MKLDAKWLFDTLEAHDTIAIYRHVYADGDAMGAQFGLKALIEAGHEVCGVFSQPDKPVGRHQNKLKPTPVKECALSYQAAGRDIPVYQPEKLRDGTALAI